MATAQHLANINAALAAIANIMATAANMASPAVQAKVVTASAQELPDHLATLRRAGKTASHKQVADCVAAFAILWHHAGQPTIEGASGAFAVSSAFRAAKHSAACLANLNPRTPLAATVCSTTIVVAIGAALLGPDRLTCSAREAIAAFGAVAASMLAAPTPTPAEA